jgi:hypothetical protein
MAPSTPPSPSPLDGLIPDDPLIAIAWTDCLRWALGDPDTLQTFRADKGNAWKPGVTPIERWIDEASGADREFVREFAAWFNANLWGDMLLDDVKGVCDA